jgi:hypothetical protein
MKKEYLILIFFILLKFTLQYFAIDPVYELHRDEYLHIDLGTHLAWGYVSVPPLTGIISWIILLLGKTVFWVKFFPALFGALTLLVVWKAVAVLNGGLFARILAATSVIFSVLIRINTLYQPNSLDFLLWTLLFYTILNYVKTENKTWLYQAGLVFALAFLNKYNIGFLILGLLPALLITDQRRIFKNKHFYYAMIMAFFLILPNLIWQYVNDFPVIRHLTHLAATQLVNFERLNFLKEQLFFFAGSLFVILLAWLSFFTYNPHKKYRIFFFNALFTLLIFVYLRAKGYYVIGLYPILLAFGSVYLEKLLQTGWQRYLRPLLVMIPVVVMMPLYQIVLPVLTPREIVEKGALFKKYGLTRWEDGREYELPQDFADMLGWRELAGLVDQALKMVDDKKHTLIHCDNYGQAGAINFYGRESLNLALTFNADYINWYSLDDFEIQDVILVKENNDSDPERSRERALFEEVINIGKIRNPYARERGTSVYLLKNPKQSINEIFRREILERRSEH